jgi:hypothetical protein
MKVIPIGKEEKALGFFRQSPATSFTETAELTGVYHVPLNHWYPKSSRNL